jgi:general secretion pathway protein G
MLHTRKNAFTMIELVFVIVVLGILAAIAIPKFAATRTDAQISKGRADIASIRSAIITERQSRLITGDNSFISGINLNKGGLFGGVLMYPMAGSTEDGHWSSTGTDTNDTATYDYKVAGVNVPFTYTRSDGKFTCPSGTTNQAEKYCSSLTN